MRLDETPATTRGGGGSRRPAESPPEMTAEQRLNRALWSLYVPPGHEVHDGPQTVAEALEVVADWRAVPLSQPIVRMVFWQCANTPPESTVRLKELLADVLGVSIERFRNLRAAAPRADFPPSTPLIRDSGFVPGDVTSVTLTVAMNDDKLWARIQPKQWPQLCPLFWREMRPGTGDGHWIGRLNTPNGVDPGEMPISVEDEDSGATSFGLATVVTLGASDRYIAGGKLTFQVNPEPERPGWTQIRHTRQITFTSEVPALLRAPTLAYWTLSEMACLLSN